MNGLGPLHMPPPPRAMHGRRPSGDRDSSFSIGGGGHVGDLTLALSGAAFERGGERPSQPRKGSASSNHAPTPPPRARPLGLGHERRPSNDRPSFASERGPPLPSTSSFVSTHERRPSVPSNSHNGLASHHPGNDRAPSNGGIGMLDRMPDRAPSFERYDSAPSYPHDSGGRKTPDPPRGSFRPHLGEPLHAHPPSAPPAPRGTGRHTKMAAQAGIPYPIFSAHEPQLHHLPQATQRPPQHPTAAHQRLSGDYPPPLQGSLAGSGAGPLAPRGSIQSTIASARSTTYGRLTLQPPPAPSAARLTNSPSPNSTPVRPSVVAARFFEVDSNTNSPSGSPRRPEAADSQRRRAIANAAIPIALSWPSDASSATPATRNAFASRGGVRSSFPSASPPSGAGGGHHGHVPSVSASANFPSILKRGAQLIEALPPTLSPERGSANGYGSGYHRGDHNDEHSDFEDVALLDLAEDDAMHHHLLSHRSSVAARDANNPTRVSKNGRIGSGARNGLGSAATRGSLSSNANAQPQGGMPSMKKLDLTGAQSFRSPYSRKSFAPAPTLPAKSSSRHDVPPAAEWGPQSESENEADDPVHHAGGGGNGSGEEETKQAGDFSNNGGSEWRLDIGLAEDANPKFRASMEDAHVIRRAFGPEYEVTTTRGGDDDSPSITTQQGSFFAVYDGHGGRAAVDFVARHFHRELGRKLAASSGADVPRAIESACARVDAAMALSAGPGGPRQLLGEEFQECGSTACFAYLRPCGPGNRGRELFIANLGDAEAVLAIDKRADPGGRPRAKDAARRRKSTRATSPPAAPTGTDSQRTPKKTRAASVSGSSIAATARDGPASFAKTLLARPKGSAASSSTASTSRKLSHLKLSYAHTAKDPREMARIKAEGGCVFGQRVAGSLAVSRAFGDCALKSAGLSCVPYQQHVELTNQHQFLIIGCDGIWDVMDGKQAVDSIAGMTNAQAMAQKLVDIALKEGTTDNVSCLVVRFART